MAGNDQDVAAHAFAARRFQPVRTASLDEFDETIAIGREVAAKSFLLVRGIHGDRADCLLQRICARERARLRVERGAAEQRQQGQCPDD